ncbi:MAG: hypothetical protein VX294_02275 [Candidatus Latescibacterota bacterium]|nr:hypothetical protein [Candidatus Latescibacterota bacterium]
MNDPLIHIIEKFNDLAKTTKTVNILGMEISKNKSSLTQPLRSMPIVVLTLFFMCVGIGFSVTHELHAETVTNEITCDICVVQSNLGSALSSNITTSSITLTLSSILVLIWSLALPPSTGKWSRLSRGPPFLVLA